MVFIPEIGNVTQKEVFHKYFKWTIANFLSFLRTGDTEIGSPPFYFEGHQCAFGLRIFEKEEWIRINFLISPKNSLLRVKLGVLSPDGDEYNNFSVQNENINKVVQFYEKQHFLQKLELEKVLRSEQLNVFCDIQLDSFEKETEEADSFDGILAA